MSIRLINPIFAGSFSRIDSDARRYISAVEYVDGQSLELATKAAINNFVVGCKQDGIWPAIKSSCILAAARTLDGALIPLAGSAPTPFDFANGDYSRKTGLIGNRSTKYIDTSRANNADPQNSRHLAIWASSIGTYDGVTSAIIGADGSPDAAGTDAILYNTSVGVGARCRSQTLSSLGTAPVVGLIGISRSASASYTLRNNQTNNTITVASQTPESSSVLVFRRGNAASPAYSDARIGFYSVGEAIDLAKLNDRLVTFFAAIGVAIP